MFGLIPHKRAERKLAREFEPFGLMRPELASLFDRFFGRWPFPEIPWEEEETGLEVEDKEKEVLVKAAVPGYEPREVVIEVTGNVLTIRAEHKEKETKDGEERIYGKMMRSILLPVGIEAEKVEATCKNGVLEIVLPKKPEAMTRRIEVKT